MLLIIKYLAKHILAFHISLFTLTTVSCPLWQNLLSLELCQSEAFTELCYRFIRFIHFLFFFIFIIIFFRVNSTPESPGGGFLTEVTPCAGVLAQPKQWHRIKNECIETETSKNWLFDLRKQRIISECAGRKSVWSRTLEKALWYSCSEFASGTIMPPQLIQLKAKKESLACHRNTRGKRETFLLHCHQWTCKYGS